MLPKDQTYWPLQVLDDTRRWCLIFAVDGKLSFAELVKVNIS